MSVDVPPRSRAPHLPAAVLDRPRVQELLDRGAPLTVVRAVHGAGKTTAIAAWDRHRGGRALWIRLGARELDAGAASVVVRRELAAVARASGDDSIAAPVDGRDAGNSIADLFAAAPPGVLVLDDAGGIADADAQELVRALAAAPHLRLVVATARSTFFDGPAAALFIDRTIIGPDALMFDDDEVARLLEVGGAEARRLRQVTGGLPVALRAVAQSHPSSAPDFTPAAQEMVDHYLRLQFSATEGTSDFLAALSRMSTAAVVDAGAAVALSGDPQARAHLDEAVAQGIATRSGAGSFAFAPVLRTFLQRELERSAASELPRLRSTAAHEALRRGAPLDALRLAVAADDLALAAHVVLVSWYRLLEEHGKAVIDVLGPLPTGRLKDQPLLAMLMAICSLASRVRRVRGLQLLRVAIAAADSRRGAIPAVERLYIWTAQSAALRLIGWHRRAADVAVRALELLTALSDRDAAPYGDEIPRVCTQLGLSLHYAGHGRSAKEAWSYAAALATARRAPSAFHPLALLAGAHALDGDMPEAEYYAALIRDGDWPVAELDGYRGTFYRVAETLLALERGDVDAASAHVRAFDPHRETSEHWTVMASIEAAVRLQAGEPETGLQRLESLVTARGKEGTRAASRRRLSAARIELHLALGAAERAQSVFEQDAAGGDFPSVVLAARIALVGDRPFEALRLLARTESVAPNARLRAEAAAVTAAATALTAGGVAAARPLRVLAAVLDDRRLRSPLTRLPPEALAAVLDRLPSAPSGVASVFPPRPIRPRLSGRERVVLAALHSGDAIPAIADELGVSVNTVKTQLRSLYRKLGVADRAAAIARSHDLGLLDDVDGVPQTGMLLGG